MHDRDGVECVSTNLPLAGYALATMLRAREYCSADFEDLCEIARAIAEGWLQIADQFDIVKHGRELQKVQAKGNA